MPRQEGLSRRPHARMRVIPRELPPKEPLILALLQGRGESMRVFPGTFRTVAELAECSTSRVRGIARAHGFAVTRDTWRWSQARAAAKAAGRSR